MTSTATRSGSATRWGPLWGARPSDWAASEEQQTPTYEAALRHVDVRADQRVLDLGCGAGVFLRLVADRGAHPFGLDASPALLELARTRVPEADLRSGDLEFLPYDDDSFDLVAGFNSFFFASDMVAALREAGRVAKPGAPIVIQVWGPAERCDLEAVKAVARQFFPSPPAGARKPSELCDPGVLESMATQAGLDPQSAFDVRYAIDFPDAETLGRQMMAPMGLATVAGPEREASVRAQIVEALARCRSATGRYVLHNEFHYLVATRR